MAAREITDRLVKELSKGTYDFYVVNYAEPDMVAHTGNFQATIEALEIVDDCLKQVVEAIFSVNGVLYVTATMGIRKSY